MVPSVKDNALLLLSSVLTSNGHGTGLLTISNYRCRLDVLRLVGLRLAIAAESVPVGAPSVSPQVP